MHRHWLSRARCALAGLLLTGLWGATNHAAADIIISPPGLAAGNGQSNSPFTNVGDTNGNRYQQIYSASFFQSVGPLQSISSVAFRPKQGAFGSFIGSSLTISDLTIRLSTTLRTADTNFPNGLNGDLATNVGADVTTVFSGPITLTTDRLLFDTDVEDFDFLIAFASPFLYRPALGNLLLEVIIPAGATVKSNGTNFPQIDTFTDGFPSLDGTGSATDANLADGSTIGSNTTTGAVTRFETAAVVPEPASLVIWGLISAAGGVAVWRRPRSRRTAA